MKAEIITASLKRDPKNKRVYAEYNREFYRKVLKPHWKRCIKEAIKAMVAQVHVDTGMTQASIHPLGKMVGMQTQLIEALAGKGPSRKPGHKKLFGKFANNNARYKSRALGRRLGNQALSKKQYVVNFGTPKRPVFTFKFEIVVFQWFLHETVLSLQHKAKYTSSTYSTQGWDAIGRANRKFKNIWKNKLETKKWGKSFLGWLLTGEVTGLPNPDPENT